MRIIIGCEYSQVITKAFRERGHEAYSCDILPCEGGHPEWHFMKDILVVLEREHFDLGIFHPPCTHLAVSGARWFKDKKVEQEEALEFVRLLLNAPIEHIALENPISIISSRIRKPDQIIQPWQFGHGETKATCFWLKNLPRLKPSNIVEGREQRVWKMPPGINRWKERSRTLPGIGEAIANQWSKLT